MSQTKTEVYSNIGLTATGSDSSKHSPKTVDLYNSMGAIKLAQVLKRELGSRKQSEVARECGISRTLLNDWISARRIPSAKNLGQLNRLAKFLGLTLEQILFDEQPRQTNLIASTRFTDNETEYRVCIEKVK